MTIYQKVAYTKFCSVYTYSVFHKLACMHTINEHEHEYIYSIIYNISYTYIRYVYKSPVKKIVIL